MSEASWEEDRKRDLETQERALHARYHVLDVGNCRYGVITPASRCDIKGEEYINYRFVNGLERLKLHAATRSARALNRGDTKEDVYKRNN